MRRRACARCARRCVARRSSPSARVLPPTRYAPGVPSLLPLHYPLLISASYALLASQMLAKVTPSILSTQEHRLT